MKALTIWNPWAVLIAHGEKRIETRHWPTAYRGQLAIHAGARRPTDAELSVLSRTRRDGDWRDDRIAESLATLGHIIAVVDLVDCKQFTPEIIWGIERHEHFYGYVDDGRWGWWLGSVRRVEPLAVRGMPGLWTLSPELEESLVYVDQ